MEGKEIDFKEVQEHRTGEDCWVVIHGNVYNLTPFLSHHPGGSKVILKEAGKDATKAFDTVHSLDIIKNNLPKNLYLGKCINLPSTVLNHPKSTQNKPPINQILNLFDLESIAKQLMTKQAWAYYSSAADDEITLRENHAAFHRISLVPRVLVNVSSIDTSTIMMGTKVDLPIYISATALGKLGHPEGEVILTRGAGTRNIIQMIPTLSSCSIDEMITASTKTQTQWFQLYVNQNRLITQKIIQHVQSRGVRALCITVDAPCLGKRERDMRVKFIDDPPDLQSDADMGDKNQGAARAISTFIDASLCWKDIAWFKSITKMPIILKGIQCAEDAILAVQYGVDGIIVSNHGGRQLDTTRSGIEMLVEIIQALKTHSLRPKIKVFVDGGFKRGTDIFKALAIGADGIGLGRPFLYGMSSYGQVGVEKVVDILREELEMCMRMMGVCRIDQINETGVILDNLEGRGCVRDFLSEGVYEGMEVLKASL